ncbi:hypothetical protein N6H14_32265 [Paenibacillus sp. CC-CFT747]|nr:hypothetical protein N6H14_32265 [Paenibacillus sp. CC-CFT747]
MIVFLAAFGYLSFSLYQGNIRNEIIRYNEQNIGYTTERYEEHFKLVQKEMYALYFHDEVSGLPFSSENQRYELLDRIRQQIVKVVSNPLLYIDNGIFVFREGTLTLSKLGTTDRKSLFEKYYASQDYPDSFWQQQLEESTYTSKAFAMSSFYEYPFYQSGQPINKGLFIPYINKHWQKHDFYVVAMLDANKLFDAFHRSVNANFIIYDEHKTPIFSTVKPEDDVKIPELSANQTYILHNNTYYFYRVGAHTGFTYLNIVPGASIAEQVASLNLTSWVLLVLALLLSAIVSILFSIRFHNPVKRMVSSLQQTNGSDVLFKSNIREFNLIGQKLNEMLKTNAEIQSDLLQKTPSSSLTVI